MPVSNNNYEQQRTASAEVEPNEMFTRENLDREGLRLIFADPNDLSVDDEFIERDDKAIPNPNTLSMPVGPTGAGEVGGGGMETIRLEGERWRTLRYAHGFEMHQDGSDSDLERQRNYIMKTFDFMYDLNFLYGLDGIGHWNGVMDEVRSRIPEERVFDCTKYDGTEASDIDDFSDVPEDLIAGEAMKSVRGEIVDFNEGWDVAIGSHNAITQLNYSAGVTDGVERGPSFKQRMQDANAVQNFVRLPYKTQIDYLPDDADDDIPDFEEYSIVEEGTAVEPNDSDQGIIGEDELFLFPDMDTVMDKFWDIREMGTPEHYGPVEQRKGKVAHDYVNRFSAKADPTGEYADFPDVVHIKNPSAIFG